jgi:hypothetical protein
LDEVEENMSHLGKLLNTSVTMSTIIDEIIVNPDGSAKLILRGTDPVDVSSAWMRENKPHVGGWYNWGTEARCV